jgi:hypothetical protein
MDRFERRLLEAENMSSLLRRKSGKRRNRKSANNIFSMLGFMRLQSYCQVKQKSMNLWVKLGRVLCSTIKSPGRTAGLYSVRQHGRKIKLQPLSSFFR